MHSWGVRVAVLDCVRSFFAGYEDVRTLLEMEDQDQNPNQQLQLLPASADGKAGVQSLGSLHMPLLHNGPIRLLDLD